MEKERAVTLEDVARLAGVSYQTVSRVVNNAPNVAEKTRVRVSDAVAELGYVPNRMAQRLAGKCTKTIGLATVRLSFLGLAEIAESVEREAKRAGFNTIISIADFADAESLTNAVSELKSQLVDAVVVSAPIEQTAARQICERLDVPCLFLDLEGSEWLTVGYDNRMGGRLAASYLLEKQHNAIAAISGPMDSYAARDRLEAWQQVLGDAELELVKLGEGDWSAKSAFNMVSLWLASGVQFSALLVGNDQMALGAIKAITERGLSVPEDISVFGYDDTTDSAFFRPSLTTIRQDFSALGQQSVALLLDHINGDISKRHVILQPELVERQSVIPAGRREDSDKAQRLDSAMVTIRSELERLIK